ncbi:MAG: tetratricopeptide repeat protein [Flavobacteriales bacterium]|nr:tetratricopeptide repeat protein [Flavobacteriales bacterium]MCB9193836.1 tetratricopeptide repeat protein [Flavobacteriales bacterium]
MMKYAIPTLAILLFVACGTGPESTSTDQEKDGSKAAEMVGRIHTMEDTLFAKNTFDMRGAAALLDVYKSFAQEFPTDTMAPEYLFRGAGVAKALGRPNETLTLYDRIINDYPQWRRIPDTYYLKAFTLDNDLGQKGAAEQAYRDVIARYPDHRFAKDAQAMIDNLGLTDQELIEKFEKMNADSAKQTVTAGR